MKGVIIATVVKGLLTLWVAYTTLYMVSKSDDVYRQLQQDPTMCFKFKVASLLGVHEYERKVLMDVIDNLDDVGFMDKQAGKLAVYLFTEECKIN